MEQMNPRISVEYADKAAIVGFTDEKILEEKDVRDIEKSLFSLMDQTSGVVLILDFSNVKFMSSAVLGLLIKVSKHVYEQQGKLALCGISPKIYEIFKITRLTKIFDIYKDSETAIIQLAERNQ